MSMNPTGNETHMTLADAEAVFGIDFPPLPVLTSTLVIVHTVGGDYVFEVHGIDAYRPIHDFATEAEFLAQFGE